MVVVIWLPAVTESTEYKFVELNAVLPDLFGFPPNSAPTKEVVPEE
jgi:hypothetical protein